MDNTKFFISQSRIVPGEKGLFAANLLPAGTILTVDFYRRNNSNTGVFEQDYIQSKTTANINHLINPNTVCKYNKNQDAFVRYAVRDIARGEEITANYREILNQAQSLGQIFMLDWMFFEKK